MALTVCHGVWGTQMQTRKAQVRWNENYLLPYGKRIGNSGTQSRNSRDENDDERVTLRPSLHDNTHG